jgi:hypothetical protein
MRSASLAHHGESKSELQEEIEKKLRFAFSGT